MPCMIPSTRLRSPIHSVPYRLPLRRLLPCAWPRPCLTMGPPSLVSHTSVFLRTIFHFLANILHLLFLQPSPSGRLTHRPTQAQVGRINAPIAIVPLYVHSISRLIWIHTTPREQSHLYVPTVAASALSAGSMTFSVIGPPFIGTKHHLLQCTRIRPEFRNLPLVLLRALELGVINVERAMLGARGVATVMMSSKG
jgi:hypothetical protein